MHEETVIIFLKVELSGFNKYLNATILATPETINQSQNIAKT